MKKLLLFTMSLIFISCDIDEQGNTSNGLGYFILIAVIAFVIYGITSTNNYNKTIKDSGIDLSLYKKVGKYIGGHPEINESVDNVCILKYEGKLLLFILNPFKLPVVIPNSGISIADIDDITVNDASEIEHKITIGRIFLVGIFALGLRKKKKHEMAFVVIDWHKGKFNNSTTFYFEGKYAMNKANTARNELIKMCE